MKINGSWIGHITQQFGKSIVFFNWKGIQCGRAYVTPANPRTTKQVAVRSLFSSVQFVALNLLVSIIQKFWKKQAIKKSGFNAFMGKNMKAMTPTFNPAKLIFSVGSMTIPPILSATYNDQNGEIKITWNVTPAGNQLATDKMCGVIFNADNNACFVNDVGVLQSAGSMTFTGPTGLAFSDLSAFLFEYRNLGEVTELMSNSYYSTVSEP